MGLTTHYNDADMHHAYWHTKFEPGRIKNGTDWLRQPYSWGIPLSWCPLF